MSELSNNDLAFIQNTMVPDLEVREDIQLDENGNMMDFDIQSEISDNVQINADISMEVDVDNGTAVDGIPLLIDIAESPMAANIEPEAPLIYNRPGIFIESAY